MSQRDRLELQTKKHYSVHQTLQLEDRLASLQVTQISPNLSLKGSAILKANQFAH